MVNFADKLAPLLVTLSHQLLDEGQFHYVESFANLLAALRSGRWNQLPGDEQIYWLEKLESRLIGRDSLVEYDPTEYRRYPGLEECVNLIAAELKVLRGRP
jgi:hypothetical protein